VTTTSVTSGQSITSATLGNGDIQFVQSGGTALDTTVGSGGTQYISSGGSADSTTVDSGGEVDLANDAIFTNPVFSGGTEVLLNGETITGDTLALGALQDLVVSSGAEASNPTVNSGGSLTVLGGGTALGLTVADGGSVDDFGTLVFNAKGVSVSSGASVRIESGGSASVDVSTVSGIIVLSGGTASIGIGGNSVDPVVSAGGTEIVSFLGELTLSGTGQSDAGTTFSGGTEQLEAGATLTGRTLTPDALEELIAASGGTATDIIVSSGGTEIVYSGGTAIGGVVYSDGVLERLGSSTVINATFSGGTEILSSGAALTGAVLTTGGLQELLVDSGGTANATSVGGGSLLSIGLGGLASGTVISNGGTETIAFGGVDSNAVVSSGGLLNLAAGTLEASESPGGTLGEYGTIGSDGIAGDGEIIETGSGTLLLDSTDTGYSGDITIIDGTVEFAASEAVGSGTVTFSSSAGASATLRIDSAAMPANGGTFADTLFGFVDNDTLDLPGFTYSAGVTTATLSGTTLEVSNGGTMIDFVLSNPEAAQYYAHSDGGDGTIITDMPCYCPGTLIRTAQGEVAVETLAIGDRVVTFGGGLEPIRWIGRRSYAGRFLAGKRHLLPVCVKAGALEDGVPRRDLFVSPNHALYLDGALVPVGLLVNGVSVVQAEATDAVHYVHIELAGHGVIWAEGAPSETFVDDDSRAMFHNAHEYHARYPDAPSGPALYCAPRLQDGYALEAVRRRIDARAGLVARAPDLGQLRGFLDRASAEEVRGWAQDVVRPEVPVCLDVLVDGVLVAQTLAGLYRGDLEHAGLGSGRHGFAVRLPAGIAGGVLEVRRSADGALLGRAPLVAAA